MQRSRRLLYFFRSEDSSVRPSFVARLEADGWQVDCVAISHEAPFHGVLGVLGRRCAYSSYDVVAAGEYFLTWAACLRLFLHGGRPKVVAVSFNQSARLLLTGLRPIDRLLNRIWRRVALFLVHSRAEARLFERLHGIPADRFVFSHWGYDLPAFGNHAIDRPREPYVTMIGRNNRDVQVFRAAAELAGVKGVLITSAYMVDAEAAAPSKFVEVLVDRPLDECLAYLAGSFAHLVLVSDAHCGAGHISAVSAMLLGKPQVFSDVPPLADYLVDDFNGIAVPVGDAPAVADAIKRLQSDAKLAARLGAAGKLSRCNQCLTKRRRQP